MKKNKINKESKNSKTAHDKGVNSTGLLGNVILRIKDFLSKMPCFIDIHDYYHSSEWYPSITAKIVTEYKFTTECLRCGKTHITHQKWDGKHFYPLEDDEDYEKYIKIKDQV